MKKALEKYSELPFTLKCIHGGMFLGLACVYYMIEEQEAELRIAKIRECNRQNAQFCELKVEGQYNNGLKSEITILERERRKLLKEIKKEELKFVGFKYK